MATTGSVVPPWRFQCATTSRTSSSETQGAWSRRGTLDDAVEQEHVPLADQALGAGLIEDHPAVRQGGDREGHAARDVGLDDAR